jgi:hypothetical protein
MSSPRPQDSALGLRLEQGGHRGMMLPEPEPEPEPQLDSPFTRADGSPRTPRSRWNRAAVDTYTVQDVYDVWVPEYLRKLFPSVIVDHVRTQFQDHEITGSALLEMRTDEDLTSCGLDEELVRYGDRVQILSAISDCRRTQRGTWASLTFDQKVSHPALITCAVLAMGVLLVYLQFILVPLVMSIFFSYFLQPVVELLADRPLICCGRECCVEWCGSVYHSSGGNIASGRHAPLPGYRKLLVRIAGDRKSNPDRGSGAARWLCKSVLLVRFPRWLAVATAFTVFFLVLTGIVVLIIEAVDKMLERKEEYQERYSELYNATRDTLADYDVDLDQVLETTGQDGATTSAIVEGAFTAFTSLGGFFADLLLVLLFASYLLMEKKSFLAQARLDMAEQIQQPGAQQQGGGGGGQQGGPGHTGGGSHAAIGGGGGADANSGGRIETLAKFDDAVRTYINYKFGLSAGVRSENENENETNLSRFTFVIRRDDLPRQARD